MSEGEHHVSVQLQTFTSVIITIPDSHNRAFKVISTLKAVADTQILFHIPAMLY